MIGQRSMGLGRPGHGLHSQPAEISGPSPDLDEEISRRKSFCHIVGYQDRNTKTFIKRVGNSNDPIGAISVFERITSAITAIGKKLAIMTYDYCVLEGGHRNSIPCDLAFFPKNEEGCQLAQRVANVISYLTQKCERLLETNIIEMVNELQSTSRPLNSTCPPIGQPMTRDIRRMMISP